jgi:hypothetical protein
VDNVDRQWKFLMEHGHMPTAGEQVTGWRAWYLAVTGSIVKLQSLTFRDNKDIRLLLKSLWPTGGKWMEAHCLLAMRSKNQYHQHLGLIELEEAEKIPLPGVVPVKPCDCGLYAARDLHHLVELGYNTYPVRTAGEEMAIIGEVEMAGKIVLATNGYRAQRARPKTLLVPHAYWRFAEPLRRNYQCEVKLWNTVDPLRGGAA